MRGAQEILVWSDCDGSRDARGRGTGEHCRRQSARRSLDQRAKLTVRGPSRLARLKSALVGAGSERDFSLLQFFDDAAEGLVGPRSVLLQHRLADDLLGEVEHAQKGVTVGAADVSPSKTGNLIVHGPGRLFSREWMCAAVKASAAPARRSD